MLVKLIFLAVSHRLYILAGSKIHISEFAMLKNMKKFSQLLKNSWKMLPQVVSSRIKLTVFTV